VYLDIQYDTNIPMQRRERLPEHDERTVATPVAVTGIQFYTTVYAPLDDQPRMISSPLLTQKSYQPQDAPGGEAAPPSGDAPQPTGDGLQAPSDMSKQARTFLTSSPEEAAACNEVSIGSLIVSDCTGYIRVWDLGVFYQHYQLTKPLDRAVTSPSVAGLGFEEHGGDSGGMGSAGSTGSPVSLVVSIMYTR
jgi:hypothetical protein